MAAARATSAVAVAAAPRWQKRRELSGTCFDDNDHVLQRTSVVVRATLRRGLPARKTAWGGVAWGGVSHAAKPERRQTQPRASPRQPLENRCNTVHPARAPSAERRQLNRPAAAACGACSAKPPPPTSPRPPPATSSGPCSPG